METTLPEGVTQDMVDAAKQTRKNVSIADLYDASTNELIQSALMASADAQAINQFERFLDKETGKAKKILVKASLLSHKEINDLPTDNVLFLAAFSAAADLLPAGKAVVKKL